MKFLVFLISLFLFVSAEARQLRVDSMIQAGTPFPFTVASGDSFRVDNNPGGVTVIRLPGSFLNLPSSVDDIFVNLDNDTVYIDSLHNGGDYALRFNLGIPNAPSRVRIRRGGLKTDTIAGHGLPVSNNRIFDILSGDNITIDSVDCTVDGHNSNIVNCQGGYAYTYLVTAREGTWLNYSQSFSSRETSNSATWFTGTLLAHEDDFNCIIDNVDMLLNPHHAIISKAKNWIHKCSIMVDARNSFWDSTKLDDGILGGTGESADNSYAINARQTRGGTIIDSNYIYSGDNHQGSRGILLEDNLNVSVSDSVKCFGNKLNIHAGPSGENLKGVTRVVRARGINGTLNYMTFHDNELIGTYDKNLSTSAIGYECYGLDIGAQGGVTNNCSFYNNIIRMRNLTPGENDSGACIKRDGSQGNNLTYGNTLIGSTALIKVGDPFSGTGGTGLISNLDNFQFYDTTVATGDPLVKIPPNKKTFVVGGPFPACGIIVIDGAYSNGASDTAIFFESSGAVNSAQLYRSTVIYVKDLGNQPVLGATVWAIDNYGHRFDMPLTTAPGGITQYALKYWHEQSNTIDSFSFNNFIIWAKKGADSASTSLTLRHNIYTDTIQLPISSDAMLNLDSLIIDSVQNDYLNESDRVRVRSYTGAQAYPDSTKFCWSTSGFPDSSGANCVSHSYNISYAFTDTITPTINESDTLYISSWIFDADSTSGRATYFKYFDEPAVCSLSATSINFGSVNVGSTKDTTIIIKNIGGNTIDSTISLSCGGFSIISGGGSFSLQDQQTRTVTIRFTPSISGNYNCSFTPDGLCGAISLSGTGVAVSVGQSRKGFRGRR